MSDHPRFDGADQGTRSSAEPFHDLRRTLLQDEEGSGRLARFREKVSDITGAWSWLKREATEMSPRQLDHLWKTIQRLHQQGNYAELPRFSWAVADSFVTDIGNEIKLGGNPSEGRIAQLQEEEQEYMEAHNLAGKVQQLGRAGPEYNCWGFTFTGGTGWLNNPNDVQRILDDHQYQVTSKPQPGDVIVYRTPDTGEITHTGIVTKAEPSSDGETYTLEVDSKWGALGLYRHAPDDAPPDYGTWQIYHSDRPGGSLLTPKPIAEKQKNQAVRQ